MLRTLLAALLLALSTTVSSAAEVRNFAVKGAGPGIDYEGTVRVTPVESAETEALFMTVDWTFGVYVVKGYGIVAKDDPLLLTVSYVVPAGLGVARYQIQPNGTVIGSLVGEKGIFVQEVWTSLDTPTGSHTPSSNVLTNH